MQIKLETFKERCEIHFHAVVEGEEWKDAQQKATIDLAIPSDSIITITKYADGVSVIS